MRHWKQQYSPDACFVWTKSWLYNGVQVSPGDPVENVPRHRLKWFWDAKYIELAPNEAWKKAQRTRRRQPVPSDMKPHGLFDHTLGIFIPPWLSNSHDVSVTETGGGWFEVTVDGGSPRKIQGQSAVNRFVASLE